jgi:cell wall-associated NlpC family hydrolase
MITAQDIVKEAESWIGTPFKHQGRIKGVGIDCYGLVVEVARHFGITKYKSPSYGRIPQPGLMWKTLRQEMIESNLNNAKPGYVFFMAFDKSPMHLAIFDGENIIHALALSGKCVKQRFTKEQAQKVRGVFYYKGVEY